MFDLFGRKRRLIDTLTARLWTLEAEASELQKDVDEYQKGRLNIADELNELELENSGLALQNRSRELQIENLTAEVRSLQDGTCELTERLGAEAGKREAVMEALEDREETLRSEQEDNDALANELGEIHTKLIERNREQDRTHEWLGEWAQTALRTGQVKKADIQQIADGWSTPDGQYPWDE